MLHALLHNFSDGFTEAVTWQHNSSRCSFIKAMFRMLAFHKAGNVILRLVGGEVKTCKIGDRKASIDILHVHVCYS